MSIINCSCSHDMSHVEVKKFTVSDYLLTRLKQLGLDKVFQVPGDYIAEFMDVLENFTGIDAVGEINELGAGYAADGYARYKGIGAVSVQLGVGTFSVLNAIAGAYVERNPVVVITASPSTNNRKAIQQTGVVFHNCSNNLSLDRDVFSNVTVAAEIISDSQRAAEQIDHALSQAITHRRPVYLEAWQDVWGLECDAPEGLLRPIKLESDKVSLDALLVGALQKISQARQPVILVGAEVGRFELQEELVALLRASGLPYATTLLGKSTICEMEGKFIGTYAGAASGPETADYINNSDCVVALGVIFTDDFLPMLERQFENMIAVDVEKARLGSQHFQDIVLNDFIDGLIVACDESRVFPRYRLKRPIIPYLHKNTPELLAQPLGYETFLNVLFAFLFEEELLDQVNLVLGEGSSLYQASRLIGLDKNAFVSNAVWGSLGHETGCVAGTSMASDKRSLVVAGDGGFMMMCQSLSTIARNKLSSVIFVMSNEVYASEQAFMDVQTFAPDGAFAPFEELPHWDYQNLAEAYGIPGYRVNTCEKLLNLLTLLQVEPDQPALVEVVIQKRDLAPALADMVRAITGKWPDENKIRKQSEERQDSGGGTVKETLI